MQYINKLCRLHTHHHGHSHYTPDWRRLLRLQLKLLRRRPLLMVVERRTYKPSIIYVSYSTNPLTNHLTDRLRRPLHNRRSPLLPPLRLLRRRLLARPSPRTQKPSTTTIPRLDAATQHTRPALLLSSTRRAHVQRQQPAEPILRPAAAAPRQLRHAEQHFRAAAASLSGW